MKHAPLYAVFAICLAGLLLSCRLFLVTVGDGFVKVQRSVETKEEVVVEKEIGLFHRGDLIDALNRQSKAIETSPGKFEASQARSIQQAELAANRVVDRTGCWLAGILGGSIILAFGMAWLIRKK